MRIAVMLLARFGVDGEKVAEGEEEKRVCVCPGRRFWDEASEETSSRGRNQQREPNFVLVPWVL